VTDDRAITLKEAAIEFGFSRSTLLAEHRRGRLNLYKIGRTFRTTAADIAAMIVACRVVPKARDSISIRDGAPTQSATARASSALAAANETVLRLKNISRNTSARSINRNRPGHR
jgi:hypothetical protein